MKNIFQMFRVNPYHRESSRVAEMFSMIVPKYDFLNHLFSFGLDFWWRNKLVELLAANKRGALLDIATGTGDVAFAAAKKWPFLSIVGVDFSEGMIKRARAKALEQKLDKGVRFEVGDALKLSYSNRTFDWATMAFGLRNVEDYEAGLREIARVLKPGGKLLILEFSRVKNPILRLLYVAHLRLIIPLFGRIFSQGEAYSYLAGSIQDFTTHVDVCGLMTEADFRDVRQIPLTFGVVSIYEGICRV